MLTYGDGLSDVNIKKLLNFHISHKKLVSLTAVRPSARFGELSFEVKKWCDCPCQKSGIFSVLPNAPPVELCSQMRHQDLSIRQGGVRSVLSSDC